MCGSTSGRRAGSRPVARWVRGGWRLGRLRRRAGFGVQVCVGSGLGRKRRAEPVEQARHTRVVGDDTASVAAVDRLHAGGTEIEPDVEPEATPAGDAAPARAAECRLQPERRRGVGRGAGSRAAPAASSHCAAPVRRRGAEGLLHVPSAPSATKPLPAARRGGTRIRCASGAQREPSEAPSACRASASASRGRACVCVMV